MDNAMNLAEQHILESASRLRHIDEMVAQVRSAQATAPATTRTETLLSQIESDRHALARELKRLAQELEDIKRQPRADGSAILERGVGLKGLLEKIGLRLEQVLGAVFDKSGNRPG